MMDRRTRGGPVPLIYQYHAALSRGLCAGSHSRAPGHDIRLQARQTVVHPLAGPVL